MGLSALLETYDHVLLDLDGCVWVAGEPTPRSVQAVAALRSAGKRVAFVTNDARYAGEDLVRRLWSGGFQASLEEVVTVGGALQHVLFERFQGQLAVVIGSRAMHRHVHDAGLRIVNDTDMIPRAGVVVVAGHERFDYAELLQAVRAVRAGATIVAAGRDATFPGEDGLHPGTGSILAAVEFGGGAPAEVVVGKPDPQLFLTAMDRLGPGRALMIGDRLDADVAGAHAAGIDAALVLSGVTAREDMLAPGAPQPVAVAANLGDLVLA